MITELTGIHHHSEFSIFDGLCSPAQMVAAAKEKGLRSIALTDHGHCHGHADFWLAGKKQGVRTIFGVEAYVIDSLEAWKLLKDAKEESDEDATNIGTSFKAIGRKGHLVILACDRAGLANLYQLVYLAHRDGYYGKPRMDKAMLRSLSAGLVASSACMGGVVSNKLWALQRGECGWDDVKREALEFDAIFGRGRFYLELQLNESESQRYINEGMIRLHDETGIPLSITMDSHYVGQDGWAAQEVLYMLRSKKTMATRGPDWKFEIKQLYIKSPAELWASYLKFGASYIPARVMLEAAANTVRIDGLVADYEPDTHTRLATIKGVADPLKEMGLRCIAELKRRGLDKNERYAHQLLLELKVVKDKGFASYFLIVQKMVEEAKKEMLVGPGRGSAAAGLICYMLGITDLDPLKHDLMFERFLDPARCFIEGTVVCTQENGHKRIEDVEVGEHVLSHKNRWQKVLSRFSYDKSEQLIAVSYEGCGYVCTGNHRILVLENGEEKFVEARTLVGSSGLFLVNEQHQPVEFEAEWHSYQGKVFDLEVEQDRTYQIFGLKFEWMTRYGYGHPRAIHL